MIYRMEIKAKMFYKACGNVFLSYRPVFVIIISVPSSLNLLHKSSFSNFTEIFLLLCEGGGRPKNQGIISWLQGKDQINYSERSLYLNF